jgi:hypothetical protein
MEGLADEQHRVKRLQRDVAGWGDQNPLVMHAGDR